MTGRIGGLFRANAGTAAIEFAFIVPIMLMLFAGVVEIGRAFQVYNAVDRLATQYAITWSDCSEAKDVQLRVAGPNRQVGLLVLDETCVRVWRYAAKRSRGSIPPAVDSTISDLRGCRLSILLGCSKLSVVNRKSNEVFRR